MAEIFFLNAKTPFFLTLDHMGTPHKNQNFENRASTCFKLAQIRPRSKIFPTLELLVALENADKQTDRQTRFMFYKYRYMTKETGIDHL